MLNLRGQFTIKLEDGTELGVLLNMTALGNFLAESGKDLEDLEQLLSGKHALRSVPLLMWHGVQTFYHLSDAEPPLSQMRFEALLGSSDWSSIMESMHLALQLDEPKKKPKKKTK